MLFCIMYHYFGCMPSIKLVLMTTVHEHQFVSAFNWGGIFSFFPSDFSLSWHDGIGGLISPV